MVAVQKSHNILAKCFERSCIGGGGTRKLLRNDYIIEFLSVTQFFECLSVSNKQFIDIFKELDNFSQFFVFFSPIKNVLSWKYSTQNNSSVFENDYSFQPSWKRVFQVFQFTKNPNISFLPSRLCLTYETGKKCWFLNLFLKIWEHYLRKGVCNASQLPKVVNFAIFLNSLISRWIANF